MGAEQASLRGATLLFLENLRLQECFNEQAEEWQFANGGACGICTHSAMLVATRFNGVVLGYYAEDNPTAHIGMDYGDGHDFAIIAQRWLVDYWVWRTTVLIPVPILDLEEAKDAATASWLYGPRILWSVVCGFHRFREEVNLTG